VVIPPRLIDDIRDGNTVLFLGSGASYAAADSTGKRPPLGAQLAALIADRFLNANYRNMRLAEVGEFAIGKHTFEVVQEFIRNVFLPFKASATHAKMSTFRWRALVTTNYDLIVEDAYINNPARVQDIVTILRNDDRLDDAFRDDSLVPYLKLHGCINRFRDANCQFVLSTEQYLAATNGRDKLFRTMTNLAGERPVVYVGYGLQDPDLLTILRRIELEQTSRYPHYLVLPEFDEIQVDYYKRRNIVAIAGTFEQFIEAIDTAIPSTFRGLRKSASAGVHAITSRFAVSGASLSEGTLKALELDYEFVNAARAETTPDAVRFYSGVMQGWGAIERGFDVKRNLSDSVIQDYLLDEAADSFDFILVKAYAGAGKSVFLRRVAWDTAKQFNRLCLYQRPDGRLPSNPLAEIIKYCNERIYLFIDDVLDSRADIEALVAGLGKFQDKLTIIGTARTNEWNSAPASLESLVTSERTLSYLSKKDIDALVALLDTHGALNKLSLVPPEQRAERLKQHAGRELLVALHEATSGLPFQELLHDEFSKLQPLKARQIYLTVCMLNQFGVQVRAGIIHRRFGIDFDQFKAKFFDPLEDVVISIEKRGVEDYCYTARHPHIASIVVLMELRNQEDYFNEFVGVLGELNLLYNADKSAYRQMIQSRLLQEKLDDPELICAVFDKAAELSESPDPFLYQQRALFEMNRQNGDLVKSEQLLSMARQLAPGNRAIQHSASELLFRKALQAQTLLERQRLMTEAEKILGELLKSSMDSYAYCTLVKIGIARIEDVIANESQFTVEDLDKLIAEVERDLKIGNERFPLDPFLMKEEARLAALMCDMDRVFIALKKSFEGNSRNIPIAMQLASMMEARGDIAGAQTVLSDALNVRPEDLRLNFDYGKFLMKHKIGNDHDLLFHFRRSFISGDQRYEAQLLYARQLFVSKQFSEARDLFRSLSKVRLPSTVRRRRVFPLEARFTGTLSQVEAWYAKIKTDGDNSIVNMDSSTLPEEQWTQLKTRDRVEFGIEFCMFGPEAFDLKIL
jgi:hypothetical protein